MVTVGDQLIVDEQDVSHTSEKVQLEAEKMHEGVYHNIAILQLYKGQNQDKGKTTSQRYSYADLIYALIGGIDDCHVNPKYSSDPINNKEKQ